VEVLEKSNLKGPDYFEYMQSLKSLSGLGLEEGKQHQAAWASFKAMSGINNVSVLSTSAGQYVQMLAADRDAFLKDVDKAVEEKVGVLKTELQRLQNENEAAAKQIAELQQKITQHNEQIGKITGDIAEQSAKLTNNRNNYEITYASFVEQIKSDVEKIKQYLS
jgi:septal ring factor EnvC (AmiA/AmiB activator)